MPFFTPWFLDLPEEEQTQGVDLMAATEELLRFSKSCRCATKRAIRRLRREAAEFRMCEAGVAAIERAQIVRVMDEEMVEQEDLLRFYEFCCRQARRILHEIERKAVDGGVYEPDDAEKAAQPK